MKSDFFLFLNTSVENTGLEILPKQYSFNVEEKARLFWRVVNFVEFTIALYRLVDQFKLRVLTKKERFQLKRSDV